MPLIFKEDNNKQGQIVQNNIYTESNFVGEGEESLTSDPLSSTK
jgi:hypothetical protein